jgi:hypothetical protein
MPTANRSTVRTAERRRLEDNIEKAGSQFKWSAD